MELFLCSVAHTSSPHLASLVYNLDSTNRAELSSDAMGTLLQLGPVQGFAIRTSGLSCDIGRCVSVVCFRNRVLGPSMRLC